MNVLSEQHTGDERTHISQSSLTLDSFESSSSQWWGLSLPSAFERGSVDFMEKTDAWETKG